MFFFSYMQADLLDVYYGNHTGCCYRAILRCCSFAIFRAVFPVFQISSSFPKGAGRNEWRLFLQAKDLSVHFPSDFERRP